MVRLLGVRTVTTDVVHLLEVLAWIHARKTTVFVGVDLSDDLLHQRVFEDDVAETLMVNGFENCILVRSLQSQCLQQVKPEIFDFVRVEVDQLKVLS